MCTTLRAAVFLVLVACAFVQCVATGETEASMHTDSNGTLHIESMPGQRVLINGEDVINTTRTLERDLQSLAAGQTALQAMLLEQQSIILRLQNASNATSTRTAESGGLYIAWGSGSTCADGFVEVVSGRPGGFQSAGGSGQGLYSNVECISGDAQVLKTLDEGANRMMRSEVIGSGAQQADGIDILGGSHSPHCLVLFLFVTSNSFRTPFLPKTMAARSAFRGDVTQRGGLTLATRASQRFGGWWIPQPTPSLPVDLINDFLAVRMHQVLDGRVGGIEAFLPSSYHGKTLCLNSASPPVGNYPSGWDGWVGPYD